MPPGWVSFLPRLWRRVGLLVVALPGEVSRRVPPEVEFKEGVEETGEAREHARIRQHLADIEADPTGHHSTALVHLGGRRSRCGSWRLMYELGDPIRIRDISHRRNAYTQKG